jgi:hypothetical protein
MDIIFVTSYLTVFVGASKFLTEYANEFCKHGHKVTIIAQKIDRNNYKFYRDITLIEVGGPLTSNPLFWLQFNIIKNRYLYVAKPIRADLVVSIRFPTNFFGYLISKQNKIKHVYYCLDPFRYFYDRNFY